MTDNNPLVSPDWLAAHLGDKDLVILEVSKDIPGEAAYFTGHIPGAHYAFWKDLCWDETDRQFPDSAEAARRLGDLGVGDDTRLVIVGDTIQFGTYPYWMLVMAGQARGVVLLDGGRLTWETQGRPMTTDVPDVPARQSRSVGSEDWSSRIGRDDVHAGLGASGRQLIDMRSEEEFAGQRVSPVWMAVDHGAERKGRIPGAIHLYYERFLTEDGLFKSPDEIRSELEAAGVGPGDEVITYCRLSHRASLGWLALTRLLGRDSVRVYDGSWTEWGSMVGMPVEK